MLDLFILFGAPLGLLWLMNVPAFPIPVRSKR